MAGSHTAGSAFHVTESRCSRGRDPSQGRGDVPPPGLLRYWSSVLGRAGYGHVLDQRRRADGEKPVINRPISDDPRVRDQVVQPHRLDDYDNLAGRGAPEC